MKKNCIFLISIALLIAGMFTTACSEKDNTLYATAGALGDISVDRTKIGTHQWITVNGTYTSGNGLASEQLYVSVDGKLPTAINATDGKLSAAVRFTQPGKHTITFSAINEGIFGEGAYQQEVTKTKEVEVIASDIRCHFWNESKEETLRNLAHYKTLSESSLGLTIRENDIYGDIDYSSEASGDYSQSPTSIYDLKAERYVMYQFSTENTLGNIQYICIPQDQSLNKYVSNMLTRINYMKSDYNFTEYSYNASNISLTEEEKSIVEECIGKINAGDIKNIDPEGEIGELIKNKGLMLIGLFLSKDKKTTGGIATYYQSGKFAVLVKFQPNV